MINESVIRARLLQYQDPYLGQDLITAKTLQRIDIRDNQVDLFIRLGYPVAAHRASLVKALTELLPEISLTVHIDWQVTAHAVQAGQTGLPAIKNIIAI